MKTIRLHRAGLAAALLLTAAASSQAAVLNYTVTLNVASLVGNTSAPFSLDVALSSGAPTPNQLNTATLSNFVFTNGSAGATSYSTGGETGSMASSVVLNTSSSVNELSQYFSGGVTQISFNVSLTSNTDNPYPDQFYVSILDGGLNNIPTTDPSGGNTLSLINIATTQTLASVKNYQSAPGSYAPGVTSAVPEPGTVAGLLAGGAALALGAFRRLRAA